MRRAGAAAAAEGRAEAGEEGGHRRAAALPPLPDVPAVPTPPAVKEKAPTAEPPLIQVTGATLPDVPIPPAVMPAAGPASGSDQRPIVIPASATVTTVGTAPPMPPAPPIPTTPPAPTPAAPVPPPAAAVTPPPAGQPLPPINAEPTPAPAAPTVAPPGPLTPPPVTVPAPAPIAPPVTPPAVVPAVVPPTAPTVPTVPTEPKVIKTAASTVVNSLESEAVQPLPTLRGRVVTRPKAALPLTGTFLTTLADQKVMTLPPSIHDQLGNSTTLLVSPGSDRCLWLTNQAHLDRLQAKLDKSPARETDVRGFKRLYYAQTVKVAVKDGRLILSDRLVQFAGLGQELVLVGIDDHFEVWDAARWRRYTQTKKARDVAEE
ncbi:MAG: hypothetical protein U0736_23150 [Gemmataceae bacterium]